ncbi:MAG: hypothetical protein ACKV0T_09210 [Planctomycetales bacterium]
MKSSVVGCLLSAILLAALAGGCESPSWIKGLNESFDRSSSANREVEEQHRRGYMESRNRADMHWLLRNRITSGMPLQEVRRVLGEDGVSELRDNWIKTKGTVYQSGDQAYAFGPDSDGQTVYLVFRDGRLINFSPREFSEATP